VGIAVTALSVAVPYLLATAEAEGKEANAVKEATDALEKKIETAQQEYDQTERRETAALQVAEAYNRVRESLATMQEGSEEYKAKQEQLQDMETTLGQILHTNADQFITDNGIKMDSIKDYMGKEKSKHIQEQTDIMNTAKNNADATKTQIQSTKARIESMKEELKQVRANGNGWNWLNRVMNNARYKAALEGKKRANDLLAAANTYKEIGGISGFFNDWTVEANGGVDALVQKASDIWNKFDQQEKEAIDDAKNIGDVETFEVAIGGYEASLGHMEEVLAGHEKVAAAAAQSVADLQRGVNTDTNTATPDNNNYGREPRSRNGRKGRHEKVTIDYASDELSAAIHEAAQSDIAQQYKFTEPLLRAIAARESGGDTTIRQWDGNGNLLEDYAGSGHFGMFQVTKADAERFGTGDVSVPLNNAMTAVKLLAEKFDNTGELWKAVRAYNGGSDSYVAQVRKNFQAQKESFNFGNDDGFGLPGSFNDDVIAGVKEELGQDYGGGSWRDATVKVCTTLIQKALINAGVDENTVDNLSAWAPNWSKAGSYAFHSYSEIQSGGYIPKTGDIGLVNTSNGENGHAGHVIMIGENGEGYYAASKPGTKSAYYGTNWETAFASSGIEGVISVNELAGKPYTTSVRGGKKKPKSINDFQLDPYQEALYREQLANEDADKMTYRGKSHDFYNGGSLGQDRAALAVAELKLASQQAAKEILEDTLDSTQKNVKNALATTHKDIGEVLAKRGTTWQKLVPAERKALADLAGDDSFKKQVEAEEKIRLKIVQTTKAIEEQRQARDKAMGYMNVDERNKYMADRVVKDYDMLHPNDISGSPGRRKVLEIQREYLEENLRRAKERYADARAKGVEERSDKLADIEAAQAKLKELEDKVTAGDTTQKIADQTAEVARLKDEYQSMAAVGTKAEQDEKKAVDECTEALKNNADAIKKVQQDFAKLVFDGTVSMFTNVLAEGKSFRDSFKELWADIGKFALKQLLMIQLQSVIVKAGWGSAFGFAGGGAIPGKAIGGMIPGYASGGQTAGAITGAGTGTSDSILAYIGNKDRFVYLSNGEYVMTAEATQRIGKDNLDRMNYGKYATGGAISPTPYVPHIATSVTKKAEVLNRDNPNAKLESLMAQQTDLLRNMGKDGNGGGLVVLNTQASSEQVMKALAENPRALNAILGRNQRMGFR
ncbi:transglycosylase SLT domain-containing protein, partial [Selenomonas ruminantium]